MSNFDRTASDIFRLVLEQGPLTLYSANSSSKFPIGTIHRHFKEMENSGKIKIYEDEKKGRKKIPYGPTVYGFISFYRLDENLRGKLEDYFLKWVGQKEFLADLKREGFDTRSIKKNPNKTKKVFRKYVHYFAGVEEQLELLKEGSATIPREVSLFVGEALVAMKPEYLKIWQELYKNLPGIRKNVDAYMKNTIELHKSLQRLH